MKGLCPTWAFMKIKKYEKYTKIWKVKLKNEGVLSHLAAAEHMETIGNVCGFAHAKYSVNPLLERMFYAQITFVKT